MFEDMPEFDEKKKKELYFKMFASKPKNHFVDMPDKLVLKKDIERQNDIISQIELLIEDMTDSGDPDYEHAVETLQGIINLHFMRTNKLEEHFKIIFEIED